MMAMGWYLSHYLRGGKDIAVASATKDVAGPIDLGGGATVTSDAKIQARLKCLQNAVGAVPGPLDCYLVLRGIKTLAIRMERHSQNAKAISEYLAKQPKIERVLYPGHDD